MPSILITRPQAAADALADRLAALGYKPVVEPLLSITPTGAEPPVLDVIDGVIITSSNVTAVLGEQRETMKNLFDIPCFCVGPQTAEKMRGLGFRHVQNSENDGAALVPVIGKTINRKNAALLHIAGTETDGRLRQGLEALGHRVTEWPVYEAVPAKALSSATVNRLKAGKFDAVLLFSPRTAETLAELLADAALEACCAGLTAICLSEAVAKALKHLGWRQLASAPVPTEDAVITCLQTICPVTS